MRTLPALPALLVLASPASAADRVHPTVVELYQSQGCSSCVPADLIANQLASRPDLLVLSFAVTYWDQLGWKDTFSHPAFTSRQWDYAKAGRRPNVATPQVVINGRGVVTGNRKSEVEAAIARYDRGVGGPTILSDGRTAAVLGAPAGSSLWLIRYDPRTVQVPIGAGENGGKTIAHRNIVRQLIVLGDASGARRRFNIPAGPAQLRTAFLLQRGRGGPILASKAL